jgi:predicted transglutaminase-like cysteine proteinase
MYRKRRKPYCSGRIRGFQRKRAFHSFFFRSMRSFSALPKRSGTKEAVFPSSSFARATLLLLWCLQLFFCGCLPEKKGKAPAISVAPSHRTAIDGFPEWLRVRDSERAFSSFDKAGLALWPAQRAENWLRLRDRLRNAPLVQQAVEVNAFFNTWPHREDTTAWGREEYWASPLEFVNSSGDCEDFAIAKYYALRDLGAPPEKLRIAGVWNREKREGHGVLFVYDQAVPYVLDNTTPHVRLAAELDNYDPTYFVNEDYLWLRGPADHMLWTDPLPSGFF